MAVLTVADFVEALRRHQLLDDAQLPRVSGDLQRRFPDPRSLAKELLNLGWLTPYQVNQLLQGKGEELVLGSYVLLERLGEGGMGAVFKARHRRLDRVVALKLIRKERLADEEAVRRFRREIQAVSQLSHPHIVLAFDADRAGDAHFYAMEYVEGTDLGRLVQQSGPLSVSLACEYTRQAALALQHAHEKGLVHRDIKPSNLLVTTKDSRVKLLDLGLARIRPGPALAGDGSGSNSSITQFGSVVGTPDFMAPEQAQDSHKVDIRADLYSLGCTLYFLLAGRAPFSGLTPMEKLFYHRFHEACPVEDLRREVTPDVAAVVHKPMAKKREDRYQTPAELIAALEALPPPSETAAAVRSLAAADFLDMVPSDTHTSQPSPRKEKRTAERRRWLWINAGGAAVLLAAVGLFLLLLGGPRGGPPAGTEAGHDRRAEAAVEELRALRARAADPEADRDRLRADLAAFCRTYLDLPVALEAAVLLRRLPSPLDALEPVTPPPGGPWEEPPTHLVAVRGGQHQRHWGPATCLALAPGGKLLATGGDDHIIRLWDPATMKELGLLRGHTTGVASVAFSPDGKRVLSTGSGPTATARVWDVDSRKELAHLGGTAPTAVMSAAFLADGKRVLCGGRGWVGVWEGAGDKVTRRLDNLAGWVTHLALAAADRTALYGLPSDRAAHLWDLETGKELFKLDGHKGEVSFVAFSADGKQALTGGAAAARLWDVASGKELKLFNHPGPVCGVVSADGTRVLTGGADRLLRLWDAATGKEVRRFDGHEGTVRGIAFAADGKQAYSVSDDTTVRRWDLEGGKEVEPAAGPAGALTNVAFLNDGRQLFGGRRGRRLLTWDVLGEAKVHPFAAEAPGLQRVTLAPDGKLALALNDSRSVGVWDVAAGQLLRSLDGHEELVRAAALSPDGQLALTATRASAGNPRLWDVASAKEQRRFDAPKRTVNTVVFAPDGKQAASGGDDLTLRLWDVDSGKELREQAGLPGDVRSVAFSPDGRRIFVAGGDRSLRRWVPFGSAAGLALYEGHKQEPAYVAVSPDAQSVASASDGGEVIVWDAATGKALYRWQLPGPVAGVTFAPDSRHLATANGNGSVFIFRIGGPEARTAASGQ